VELWVILVCEFDQLNVFTNCPSGIQFAKIKGLMVIGIDARDEGIALSNEAGADVVFDVRNGKDKVVEEVQRVTAHLGADATICVSDHKDAAGIACAVTKHHGIMVQIAQPEPIIIPFHEIIFRGIKVHGSLLCSKEESNSMLEFIAKNGIKIQTNTFNGLDEIEKLVGLVETGKMRGKGVLIIDPEQIEKEKSIGAKY